MSSLKSSPASVIGASAAVAGAIVSGASTFGNSIWKSITWPSCVGTAASSAMSVWVTTVSAPPAAGMSSEKSGMSGRLRLGLLLRFGGHAAQLRRRRAPRSCRA